MGCEYFQAESRQLRKVQRVSYGLQSSVGVVDIASKEDVQNSVSA